MNSQVKSMPSNKKFGYFFGVIFLLCSIYFFNRSSIVISLLFMACSAGITLLATVKPSYLKPLNQTWYTLGLFLGKIVSPIVLSAIFFLIITPIAIGLRLAGRDELLIKKRNAKTYWLDRDPPGPDSESFKNQF